MAKLVEDAERLISEGRIADGVAMLRQSVERDPGNESLVQAWCNAMLAVGDVRDDAALLQKTLASGMRHPLVRFCMALAHQTDGQFEQARAILSDLLVEYPRFTQATHLMVRMLVLEGKHEQAMELLEPRLGTGDPIIACAFGLVASAVDRRDEAVRLLAGVLNEDRIAAAVRYDAGLMLARLLDEMEHFDEAMDAARRANRLGAVPYDPGATDALAEGLIAEFTPARVAALPRATGDTSRPIFLLGMPRSGTSLVEQIAASHPRVFGAGELTFFPEHIMTLARRLESDKSFPYCVKGKMEAIAQLAPAYLELLEQRADGAVRVTDKMPYNFLYLGVIAALFPRARVVHCRRDPMATCFSIYTRKLAGSHPYSYDLQELGAAYRAYERLMGHWRTVLPMPLLDLDYEGLIADQEGCTRELIAFLGLDWDPACLDFHRTKRAVTTASQWQVRRPLYASAAEHWRHYADHLEPLREVLLGAGAV